MHKTSSAEASVGVLCSIMNALGKMSSGWKFGCSDD